LKPEAGIIRLRRAEGGALSLLRELCSISKIVAKCFSSNS
jgi:hypothetical protein